MEQSSLTRVGSGRSIALAILLIFFGFLALAAPFAASTGVALAIAWLIVFSGIVQFAHAFQTQGVGRTIWKLMVATLYVAVGIYFLVHPFRGVAALTLALGIFFVFEGVFDLVEYFRSRHLSGSGWVLFDGVITLFLGLLIWKHWLRSSFWVAGTLVGISMMMTGITRLMTGLAVRRAVKYEIRASSDSDKAA